MPERPEAWFVQSGVIPYRQREGTLEVLLVTSRRRKRWVIPKGIVEPGLTPAGSARNEALEEAGVLGERLRGPLGRYQYGKWGGTCSVTVFAMEVTRVLDVWEEDYRDRAWLSLAEACARLEEEDLKAIVAALRETLETLSAPR